MINTVSLLWFVLMVFITINYKSKVIANPNDWRVIESLAEEHPYIVALLNGAKTYTCTGTIISERSVLTSGACIVLKPKFVAVGMAVLRNRSNNSSIIAVASTKLHRDYTFVMNVAEPNVTRMHSNLGIVYVVRPVLEVFTHPADIGDYFASELKQKKVTTVGYGKLSASYAVVLQHQDYQQAPCPNPKWYYCVCGNEYSTDFFTYDREFGNGAPVLFEHEVVGIAATSSGTLSLKTSGTKYNIFTVIGPYLPWIKKTRHKSNVKLMLRPRNNVSNPRETFFKYIYVTFFYVISKVIN